MLQMPEAMRDPSGAGHFNWMMLFADGNRLDLTLIPVEKPQLISRDSLTTVLLDKDNILPRYPAANDKDYIIKPPSELFYLSCCNNFWWCLQNVAKGIARDEIPYAMMMYHDVVRKELHDMISWYIGGITAFQVSSGKMGKYFKKHLPPEYYKQYLMTYSDSARENMWQAVWASCDLFSVLALQVSSCCGYTYNTADERNMRIYLNCVQNNIYSEQE